MNIVAGDAYRAGTRVGVDANAIASGLTALILGRLQRYARSGFKRLPSEHLDLVLGRLVA